MIIKVCGMRNPENIREVEGLGIDWMGLIFFAGSPRKISVESGKVKGEKWKVESEGGGSDKMGYR